MFNFFYYTSSNHFFRSNKYLYSLGVVICEHRDKQTYITELEHFLQLFAANAPNPRYSATFLTTMKN
jgi:hypothetical protein